MLSPEERDVVLSAVAGWAATVPDEPVIGFVGSGDLLTAAELMRAIADETEDGAAFLEILEHGVRRDGLFVVAERYRRAASEQWGTASDLLSLH